MSVEQDSFATRLKELSQYSFKMDSLIMDTALALSGVIPHGLGACVAPVVGSYKMGQPTSALVDNPYFVVHGIDGSASSKTKHLLRHRKVRNYAQSFTGTAAVVGSMVLPVNPYALMREGSSAGASAVHLYHFAEMARNCRQSNTLCRWLDLLKLMKTHKLLNRGVGFGLAAVPGGVSLGISVPVKLCLLAKNTGVLAQESALCKVIAMELHWRAYQEQSLANGSGGGPATAIIRELMTRRGVMGGFSHNYPALIREPAGWNAFVAKIMDI
ncbi:hypothetical protein [Pseudomonas sp. FEN]|uniref:hypothetical protein n=1 Tax=Pseudomonas sp. FEN TaxID=2767468 RepID=UPI00174D24C7|nr:hypothetical protein [Pseudomonas sp. FEN]CAD5201077.1 hypothetical protein [Pseudomonas sp. FEN]